MNNYLESYTKLKKVISEQKWFDDLYIIYQGFGPMVAHMFKHFTKIGAIISFYWGAEVKKHIIDGWGTPVFSYEKKKGVRHNTVSLFYDYFYIDYGDEILETLNKLDGKIAFVPFATTPALQEFLFTRGQKFELFQNPVIVQNYFDYKARLAWRAAEIGIPIPPDSIISLFGNLNYQELADKYGSFVIQIPISQAGGGTDFIHSYDDFKRVVEEKKELLKDAFEKTQVKITRYLSGPSLNCTGCVVNGAVALSQPDIQIVGDPAITSNPAQYIGSDFSLNAFEPEHKKQMLEITKKIGLWMGRNGYRGNFGVDFLSTVDKNNKVQEIFVSEINARFVGESQYLADFQYMKDQVPLTFFHLAEWINIDIPHQYIDFYNNNLPDLEGSAIMVFSNLKGTFKASGGLTAGVYKIQNDKLIKVREGFTLSDTKTSDEFVITNGVPESDIVIGHPRYGDKDVCLCYIMTRESIVDKNNWRFINDKWKKIIGVVKDAIRLEPCPKKSLRVDDQF